MTSAKRRFPPRARSRMPVTTEKVDSEIPPTWKA
jgi:hypothetical protein